MLNELLTSRLSACFHYSALRLFGGLFVSQVLFYPSGARAAAVSEPQALDESGEDAPRGSVSAGLLTGAALWGPHISAEYNVGDFSLSATYRFVGLGFGTQFAYYRAHEELDPLLSFGVGARGNVYLSSELSGWHVGPGIEYARLVVHSEDYVDSVVDNYILPSAHVGYRFSLGPVFLNPSASVNYAVYLGATSIAGSDTEDLFREGSQGGRETNYLGGDLRVEFGVYF